MNITLVPSESLPTELADVWAQASDGGKSFIQVIAHAPDHATRLLRYYNEIRYTSVIGPRLCELLRLAIGHTTGCRTCLKGRLPAAFDAGLTEDHISALVDPDRSEFSEQELAVIDYATKFGSDHRAIGNEIYQELRRFFDERAIVEIGMLCAQFLGFGRLIATLDLEDGVCVLKSTDEMF